MEVLVEQRYHFIPETLAQLVLVPSKEICMAGQELQGFVGRVLDENVGDPVEDLYCARQRLLGYDRSVWRYRHEREAAMDREVHRRDTPVGRIHCRKHVEVVGKLKLPLTVDGMGKINSASPLSSDFTMLEQIDRFA